MYISSYYINEVYSLSTVSSVEGLLTYMDCIEYGWMDIKYRRNYSFDNWWGDYRLLLPKDVVKYKIGTCYEQALFAYEWLINHGYNSKIIWIQQYKITTHSFVVYETEKGWMYFEHSWFPYRGIKGPFRTVNAIVTYVHSNMVKYALKYEGLRDVGYKWVYMDPKLFRKRLTGPEFYKRVGYDWSQSEGEN